MSRQPLDEYSGTVLETFKIPFNLKREFARECKRIGVTKSEQIRKLIQRWLRSQAKLKRESKEAS